MLLPELHFRQYSDEVISHQHDGQWQVVLSLYWANGNQYASPTFFT
ncbi:hypothetical protein AB6F55_02610 [Providencia hangzhouensis]